MRTFVNRTMLGNDYQYIIVESFEDIPRSGRHGVIHVRAVSGQGIPDGLMVESPKSMRRKHPVGTKFRVLAKLKYRGDTPYIYSSWQWVYDVVSVKEARSFIRRTFGLRLSNPHAHSG